MVSAQQTNKEKKPVFRLIRGRAVPKLSMPICIVIVRNESLRLPNFLEHHRALGIERFVIVDNDSSDATLEYLMDQPDVDIFSTKSPFGTSNAGMKWREIIAQHYGYARWYLILDADELLVYSEMENHDLHALRDALMREGVYALRSVMIDMYAENGVDSTAYLAGDRLIDACPFFDSDSYRRVPLKTGRYLVEGGPRVRIVSEADARFLLSMEKYPFRLWQQGSGRINIHRSPYPVQGTPPISALLHFKFLNDFRNKVDKAIEEGQYYSGSKEYKIYDRQYDKLRSPYYDGSARYEGPASLIERGIIDNFPWPSRKTPQKSA